MTEQRILFKTAKLAKEKGFDGLINTIKGMMYYNYEGILNGDSLMAIKHRKSTDDKYDNIVAPTQSLLQQWIRRKHNIHVNVDCNASGWFYQLFKCNGTTLYENGKALEGLDFKTFELALEAGLQKALTLIKT